MITIKNNKITMTRGDSLNVKVAIVKNKSVAGIKGKLPDSKELIPAGSPELSGCEVKFAMSRFFPGMVKYKLLLTKEIPTSTLALVLDPADTKDIPLGIYNYDVKLKTPKPISEQENSEDLWYIDTFISGTIQLVGECEGKEGIVNDYIHADGELEETSEVNDYTGLNEVEY